MVQVGPSLSLEAGWHTRVLHVNVRTPTHSSSPPHGLVFLFLLPESENEVSQSCLTLCEPMDSVHGISQARVLEWVAISFSRGPSQPRDRTQASRTAADALLRQTLYHLSHQRSSVFKTRVFRYITTCNQPRVCLLIIPSNERGGLDPVIRTPRFHCTRHR